MVRRQPKPDGVLKPTPPFDFAQSLDFLGHFPPTRPDQRVDSLQLRKAFAVEGKAVLVTARSTGTVEEPLLEYWLHSDEPLSAEAQSKAVDCLSFLLSLADDMEPFYAIARKDPPFDLVVEELHGYHQVKFPSPFEAACWAVLSQRVPMTVARAAKDRILDGFGLNIEVEGAVFRAFPEAAALAEADPAKLARLVRNDRKAAYLKGVVKAFAQVEEQFLREGPYEEVLAWLRGIKGMGEWSAGLVLIRALGRMEELDVTNARCIEPASRRYNQGKAMSAEAVQAIADKYGAHKGYWALYLRTADEPAEGITDTP